MKTGDTVRLTCIFMDDDDKPQSLNGYRIDVDFINPKNGKVLFSADSYTENGGITVHDATYVIPPDPFDPEDPDTWPPGTTPGGPTDPVDPTDPGDPTRPGYPFPPTNPDEPDVPLPPPGGYPPNPLDPDNDPNNPTNAFDPDEQAGNTTGAGYYPLDLDGPTEQEIAELITNSGRRVPLDTTDFTGEDGNTDPPVDVNPPNPELNLGQYTIDAGNSRFWPEGRMTVDIMYSMNTDVIHTEDFYLIFTKGRSRIIDG